MAPKTVYINLPTSHLQESVALFTAIGLTINPTFSDESTKCLVFSPTISIMLMNPERFASFCPEGRSVTAAHETTGFLLALSAESKEDVDEVIKKAVEKGAKADPTKLPQMEGMYGRSFEDLDGHVWEIGWMDEKAVKGMKAAAERQGEGAST